MIFAATKTRSKWIHIIQIANYTLYVNIEYKALLANPASSGATSYEVGVILSGTR